MACCSWSRLWVILALLFYKPKMYGDFHDNPFLWTQHMSVKFAKVSWFSIFSPSLVIDPAHPLANLRCPQPGVWPRLGINWSLMDGPPPPISLLCRLFWSHHLDKCFCCVLRCLMIVCLEMTWLDWDQLLTLIFKSNSTTTQSCYNPLILPWIVLMWISSV